MIITVEKITILLVSIPPYGLHRHQLNIGLHNIKAYFLKHNKYKPSVDIKLFTLETKSPQLMNDFQYPIYPIFSLHNIDNIVKKIISDNPKIVGFSCFVWNIKIVMGIVKLIKRNNPSITIVLGGPEASDNCSSIIKKNNTVDYVVIDEGEATFLELVESLIYKKRDITTIEGICYRHKNKIYLKIIRPILQLDKIPSPYLMNLVDLKKENNIIIETTRGCPFRCAYCSGNIRNYAKIRYFPIEKVKEELVYVLQRRVEKIYFIDDSFNINEARAREILETLIKNNHNTLILLFIRADIWALSNEIVTLFQISKARLAIGVQSLNQRTLNVAKRIRHLNILEKNLLLLDKKNIPYELEFIIGLPGDTYQDIKNDIDWALSFNTKILWFEILKINPGTFYHKNALELGLKYMSTPPHQIYKSNTMSEHDVKKSYLLALRAMTFNNNLSNKKLMHNLCLRSNLSYSNFLESIISHNDRSA